jgi:hypothetical protein
MRHLITTFILLFALVPGAAHAKRIPAPKVEPVIYEGVRYVAPNDNGRRGYIQAWDTSTNRMLWSVTVFRNFINPLLEEDVQWNYIRTLRVEDGRLIVVDERDRAYSVDLKTHAVRRLRKVPSGKPKVNNALHRTAAGVSALQAHGNSDTGFAASARFQRRSVS